MSSQTSLIHKMLTSQLIALIVSAIPALGCGGSSCYGPSHPAAHVRHVKRMQPGAPNATSSPRAELEWGQINFLHTTGILHKDQLIIEDLTLLKTRMVGWKDI